MVPPLKLSALPLPVMWTLLRRMALPAFGWTPTQLKLLWQFSKSMMPPPATAVTMTAALDTVALLMEITELLMAMLAWFDTRTPEPQRGMLTLLMETASLAVFEPASSMPSLAQSLIVVSCTIRRPTPPAAAFALRMPSPEKFLMPQPSTWTVAPEVKLTPLMPGVVAAPLIDRLGSLT